MADTTMMSASPDPPSVKAEDESPTKTEGGALGKEQLAVISNVIKNLTEYRNADGEDISALFQRMLNKRILPDYFEVIKEPVAFSTVRAKVLKKQYARFSEFVRDMALISHNAQVYNRPSAPVYKHAIALREQFKVELQKLVGAKTITAEEAELPDLGEIPEVEESPPPVPGEEEEVEEDEEDEDEDEEEDDSDDDGVRRRRRRGPRSSTAGAKRDSGKTEDGGKDDPELHKKRGRPPKVHTPMEARINTVLKGLRKFKNAGGDLKIVPFEKLPDKASMPEYYQEIKNPMAMDLVKRKAKRKKYQSVDAALKDIDLIFENAKVYNLEDSQVYKDAVELQREAHLLAEQEKKKPDSDFADDDGRIPLASILHNGDVWKVGDWVHLQNPNDVTKPIVAQIYRTWQDGEGNKWINACWYYRPEQTVHRYEKHFFENEVVKTGQYRDHQIDEVIDRCFVMFFTRYNKGRPRGFPPDKEVYVCEARYNEEKHKLNKIKTWASCVPDEVRERDYEMDLFTHPRKMKKVPSPIKHLLREDAKEDDPLPKPTWGVKNAPPIVGAVHKRPREENESPPPEPTPSPPPPAPVPERRPSSVNTARPYDNQPGSMINNYNRPSASPAPILPPQSSNFGSQFSSGANGRSPAPLTRGASFTGLPQTPSAPQTPHTSYSGTANTYNNYASATPVAPHSSITTPHTSNNEYFRRTVADPGSTRQSMGGSNNAYNPPKAIEIYHLPEAANAAIPYDIRSQFHRDDQGHILFFTTPPLDVAPPENGLGHSISYLADKSRRRDAVMRKRKERANALTVTEEEDRKKRRLREISNTELVRNLKVKALLRLTDEIEVDTNQLYKNMYGEEWQAVKNAEEARLAALQQEEIRKREEIEAYQKEREAAKITRF